jgi:hypothetical protein
VEFLITCFKLLALSNYKIPHLNLLCLMRLDDVYRGLRKVIGGAQAARRLTSAGA